LNISVGQNRNRKSIIARSATLHESFWCRLVAKVKIEFKKEKNKAAYRRYKYTYTALQ
jgi:hypothetical protein